MRAFGILDYQVEDVFRIFIRSAKRDFSDFDEEDATGCKLEKNLNYGGKTPIKCTVEITEYVKNEKYQITTSTERTTCTSTYTFNGQNDGTTKLMFEEIQGGQGFLAYMLLSFERFLNKRQFNAKYRGLIESLNNELRTQLNNIQRSKPKDNTLAD